MLGATKSILAQLLGEDGNGDLLFQCYENKSFTGGVPLTLSKAKEFLQLALKGKSKTKFIVLDGLDECERKERKDIATWFQEEVENLPVNEFGTLRVLFVSQDDGAGRHDLAQVPGIKVSAAENKADIQLFAEDWQKRIEGRFVGLRASGFHVANIIVAKSQGMKFNHILSGPNILIDIRNVHLCTTICRISSWSGVHRPDKTRAASFKATYQIRRSVRYPNTFEPPETHTIPKDTSAFWSVS